MSVALVNALAHTTLMSNAAITSLKNLPETITKDTDVIIPGYHLVEGSNKNIWCLVTDDEDEMVEHVFNVIW